MKISTFGSITIIEKNVIILYKNEQVHGYNKAKGNVNE